MLEWGIELEELTVFQDGDADPIEMPTSTCLNDFSEEYYLSHFQFRKEWLKILIGYVIDGSNHYNGLLKLPRFLIFDSRSKRNSDLLLLYYLQKLTRKSVLIDDHDILGKELFVRWAHGFTIIGDGEF